MCGATVAAASPVASQPKIRSFNFSDSESLRLPELLEENVAALFKVYDLMMLIQSDLSHFARNFVFHLS